MRKKIISFFLAFCIVFSFFTDSSIRPKASTEASAYAFYGSMSKRVMDNYLSKAVTIQNLVYFDIWDDQRTEWLRFLENTGAKLVSRAAFCWMTIRS